MTVSRRQEAMCGKKQRFKTRKIAHAALKFIQKRNPLSWLTEYKCPYCNTWHYGNSFRIAKWRNYEQEEEIDEEVS